MTADEQALFGIDKLNVPRSDIPAVTHVDYSARIQTVHAKPIRATTRCSRRSRQRTGCPVLVNTSFNVRGEPIVCTPEDAFRCFMGNEIETAGGRQLQDPAAEHEVPYHDLTAVFDGHVQYYIDFCHVVPEGNRQVASRLAPLL
jgi:hypothetical protein